MEKAKGTLDNAAQTPSGADMSYKQKRKAEIEPKAHILSEKISGYLASHDLKPPE